MSDERQRKRNWWESPLVPAALLCLLLAVYVGGYFVLREPQALRAGTNVRIYRSRAVAKAFAPLAWLDAKINHCQVHVLTTDGDWEIFEP
jgi:hypothetical protein